MLRRWIAGLLVLGSALAARAQDVTTLRISTRIVRAGRGGHGQEGQPGDDGVG